MPEFEDILVTAALTILSSIFICALVSLFALVWCFFKPLLLLFVIAALLVAYPIYRFVVG